MTTFKTLFIGYVIFVLTSLLFNMIPTVYIVDYITFGFILLIGIIIDYI